jgi:drug/metabolite transporter (DMT)-like permease
MGALILAMACSASLAFFFKETERRNYNRYWVTSANYVVATAVGIWMVVQGDFAAWPPPSFYLLAVATGFLYFESFLLYQKNVRNYGASLTGFYGKLGILLPVLLSLAVFQEWPSSLQAVGIVLAIFAIGIANRTEKGEFEWVVPLLALLVFNGLAEFMNKGFEAGYDFSLRPLWLASVFGSALIFSLVKSLREERPGLAVWGWGAVIGATNLFSSFFLIQALAQIPAAVVFPSFGVGSMLLIYLGSALVYKEQLTRLQWQAAGLALAAIFLMNQ